MGIHEIENACIWVIEMFFRDAASI
ncbi:hypothetical protein AYI70_g7135, partial [Smittium culicis]